MTGGVGAWTGSDIETASSFGVGCRYVGGDFDDDGVDDVPSSDFDPIDFGDWAEVTVWTNC